MPNRASVTIARYSAGTIFGCAGCGFEVSFDRPLSIEVTLGRFACVICHTPLSTGEETDACTRPALRALIATDYFGTDDRAGDLTQDYVDWVWKVRQGFEAGDEPQPLSDGAELPEQSQWRPRLTTQQMMTGDMRPAAHRIVASNITGTLLALAAVRSSYDFDGHTLLDLIAASTEQRLNRQLPHAVIERINPQASYTGTAQMIHMHVRGRLTTPHIRTRWEELPVETDTLDIPTEALLDVLN